jgi:hypothetical protein
MRRGAVIVNSAERVGPGLLVVLVVLVVLLVVVRFLVNIGLLLIIIVAIVLKRAKHNNSKRTDRIVRRTCTQPKLASMVTNHFHIYSRDRGVAACGARAAGAEVSGAAAQGDTIRR